jgi:DNA-binding response OmpR family regulator
MRIAVLDDDSSQAQQVCESLASAGYACHVFSSSKELLAQLRRDSVDLLIIDWQVPNLDGAEVVREIREKVASDLPVLFFTGRFGEDDIVAALAAGASDYMIKPLRRSELIVRVQAQLRRSYPAQTAAELIQFSQYVFETRSSRLTVDGVAVELTQKEFDLALLLFRHLGRPLSRAYILETVWSRDGDIPSRTMDTHMSRIRNKLKLRPENGYRLLPVYSYGYRLEQVTV